MKGGCCVCVCVCVSVCACVRACVLVMVREGRSQSRRAEDNRVDDEEREGERAKCQYCLERAVDRRGRD